MLTLPPAPTPTVTRLGIVLPAVKLRFDAVGLGAPVGHTVRKLVVDGWVAVTLITIALTPLAGMPPTPGPCRFLDWLAPSGPLKPRLTLELRMRAGTTGWNSRPSTSTAPTSQLPFCGRATPR